MRRKTLGGLSALAAVGSALFSVGVGAVPANAATALSYGFDGNAHLIVAGGSDTTWTTMIALGDLWNEDNTSPAATTCAAVTTLQNGSGSYPSTNAVANQRATAQQVGAPTPDSPQATNCNHDTVAEANPAGSSTGIGSLNGNSKGTAGLFPYEGTNPIGGPNGGQTNNVLNETYPTVPVLAINGTAGLIAAGTGVTSITFQSLPENVAAGDHITITDGTTPTANIPVTAVAGSTAGTSVTISTTSTPTAAAYTTSAQSTTAPTGTSVTLSGTDVNWAATIANGYGIPDLARSSRQPKLTGGNCAGGNELTCDTFFGFASDGVQVFSWNFGSNNRGAQLQLLTGGLTADDLNAIWTCSITRWSQVPGLQAAVVAAGQTFNDGPIVPWSQNTGSGTEGTFMSYVANNAKTPADPTFNPDGQICDRTLSDGTVPFENDTKPLINDTHANADLSKALTVSDINGGTGTFPAGTNITSVTLPSVPVAIPANGSITVTDGTTPIVLTPTAPVPTSAAPVAITVNSGTTTVAYTVPGVTATEGAPAGIVDDVNSPQDPSNWIWWGSFGLMSTFKSLSGPTLFGTTFAVGAAPLYNAGTTAGQENVSSCGGLAAEPACTGANGLTPGTSDILNATYPLSRDLYIAAPKASADCPVNTAQLIEGGNTYPAGTVCDLSGTPAAGQQVDIQLNGAQTGSQGAVREFIRFVCRSLATQQTSDPYTGTNYLTEVGSALAKNGFTLPPIQSATNGLTEGYQNNFKQSGLGRSNGSRCSVLSSTPTQANPAP